MSSDGDFGDLVKRLGRRVEAGLSEHPEPEALLAYHRGELVAARADEIEEHLAFCRACADLALAIPAFLEAEPGAAPLRGEIEAPTGAQTEAQIEAAWQAMKARDTARAEPSEPAPGLWRSPGLRLAAALVVGAGLGFFAARRLGPPAPARPSFKVALGSAAAGQARGAEGEESVLDFRSGAEAGLEVLTPEATPGPGPFRAQIVGAGGRVLFEEPGVEPTALGTFLLLVPRDALPEGRAEAQVLSGPQGEPRIVARRPLRILRSPAP